MKTSYILLVTLLATIGAGANAALETKTFTGTVGSGIDTFGLFGAAGQDLGGASYSAVYTIDDAAPGAQITNPSPGYTVFSGTDVTAPITSPISATVTVGGKTVALPADGFSFYSQYRGVSYNQEQAHAEGQAGGKSYSLVSTVGGNRDFLENSLFPRNGSGSGSYDVRPGDSVLSSFDVKDSFGSSENLQLGISHVSSVSGAPEPATWAMMALGLGMVGWQLRRKAGAGAGSFGPAFA